MASDTTISPDTTHDLPSTDIDTIGRKVAELTAAGDVATRSIIMESARRQGLSCHAIIAKARFLLVSGKVK